LRWAIGMVAALLAFAVAGFMAIPALVKSKLPEFADKQLHRKASIGEVRLNPFTLRVELTDFSLTESDGRPIAGFAGLVADLEWSSITRRAWHLAEIRLTEPKALLDIAPDGRINFAALIDDLTRDAPKDKKGDGMPRLVVDALTIERGRADFTDRRAGYSNTLAPIDLRFENLSTLPQDKGPYTLSANTARGGVLRWKGEVSLNPIAASGVVGGEGLSLPELAAYLKPYATAELAGGKAAFELPYSMSYRDARLEASVDNAAFSLDGLAVKAGAAAEPFLALKSMRIDKVRADYAKHEVVVGGIVLDQGKLVAKRDASGAVDLLALVTASAGTPAAPAPKEAGVGPQWKVKVEKFSLDNLALAVEDRTPAHPLVASIGKVTLRAAIDAEFGTEGKVVISGLEAGVHRLQAGDRDAPFLRLGELLVSGGEVNLAARSAKVASISLGDGQLKAARDKQGRISLLDFVPGAGAAPAKGTSQGGGQWKAAVAAVTLGKFAIDVEDADTGVALRAQDIGVKLTDVSSDTKHPLKFDAAFTLREGGRISAQGRAVPAASTLEANIRIERLALKPVQPVLARYVKLKLAGGSLSAQGAIAIAPAGGKTPLLRYAGGFEVADLRLDEEGGELFAAWKSVGAEQLTLTLQPNRLEVPELRLAEVNAKLLIDADRTLNATRLLVSPPPAAAAAPTPAAAPEDTADPFPVLVRRVRVQNARLEFADLSLRPQFGAKIHELNGVVNGLSTNKATRSQIELDGRVDEFGLARIRGELNPFAPRNNTDVSVVFKNIDLVSASTYAMKFAGYRIASGKISLDLNYKLRNSQLEGRNSVVLDQLTLGERVDSPDALKLPLELALAILKDADGKIDLDLPVSGSLDDPQFSYGAVIWKAVTNILTRIVTAPFRALGALFGVSGDKLESVDFDAGSAALLPPEREKLKRVATVLSKRAQLKLAVPGQYSEAADGLALRVRAVRLETARRAAIKVAEGEEPGPPDLQDSSVRSALRGLLTERHGAGEWDKRKADAEAAAAGAPVTVLQRAQRIARGEPQVADLAPLYRGIIDRLVQAQALPADALKQLAARRSTAIVEALKASGIEVARLAQPAVERTDSAPGKPVPLKLRLSSR
jgi:hypothetical protein